MQLVLSAIASGGLVGSADQYLCLLIVAGAAKIGWITLAKPMDFMQTWWFIVITAFFWVITVAPGYLATAFPAVGNVVNTVINFVSGFVVPVSSAMMALASSGIIANLDPQLFQALDTLRVFGADGTITPTGVAIAGGGAAAGFALTAMRGAAKPVLSASTGSIGHLSAPVYTTLENVAAIVLMWLAYRLAQIDPWLLVALFGVVALILLGLMIYAFYKFWRLKKGIGRVIQIGQHNPRAGLAIFAEFFVWGVGWLAWTHWARGALMLGALALWWALFLSLGVLVTGVFMFFPPSIPLALSCSTIMMVALYIYIGLYSARALLHVLEQEIPQPAI